jgi:hypothetical protein
MKRILDLSVVLTSIIATLALSAPSTDAAVITVVMQGTVGAGSSDRVLAGPSGTAGAFGPPGTLVGKPYILTYTIDDTGGSPDGYYSAFQFSSGTSNMQKATAVLSIGGASITFGTLSGNEALAARSLLLGELVFVVDSSVGPNFFGNMEGSEAITTNITFTGGNVPFTDYNWRSPLATAIRATDEVVSGFSYERSTLDGAISILAQGTLLPSQITVSLDAPQVGLWWNPNESGSGYALDYKHGVLVVTVYSYTTSGAAQWYLAAGPVSSNVFSATLDRYQSGQCISCAYLGRPIQPGNDGTMTITFTSPRTATMQLPGGRNFQIVPQEF